MNKFGYTTKTFMDVWGELDEFIEDYKNCGLAKYEGDVPIGNTLKDESLNVLYYLLYARYGNNHLANFDENQFKYKVYSIIFMYGPTWEKRLEVQEKVRGLTEEDISKGSISISNSVMNDGNEGTTDSFEFLDKINSQTGHVTKRGKLEAYSNLLTLLNTDVTADFLARFKPLFARVTTPGKMVWYAVPKEEEEEENE